MRLIRLCLFGLAAVLLFVSCASGPKNTAFYAPTSNEFDALAPGGTAYFYVDVPGMRPVLDRASLGNITGTQARDVLDMTDSSVIGVYPREDRRSFMVSAEGSYPSFRSSVSMTFSSAWKKIKSHTGAKYWRSEKQNLSMAVSSKKALLSDGDPFVTVPGAVAPEGFFELRQNAVMAGWVDNAGTPINKFLSDMGIPIQLPADRILFGFYKGPGPYPPENPLYEGVLYIEVPTVSQARAVIAIFGFARAMAVDIDDSDAGRIIKSLLSNTPILDGTTIKLKTGIMNADGIALLFNMFPIYSK